jgi:hypothetical protein
MKPRRIESWLASGGPLARLFSAPDDDQANPLRSVFRVGSAEIWRLGQQRRAQYLAALLNRKRDERAPDLRIQALTQRGTSTQ